MTTSKTVIYDSEGNDYTPTVLRNVKPGEYFTLTPSTSNVFAKGDYYREINRYAAVGFEGGRETERLLKGNHPIYIGFTY